MFASGANAEGGGPGLSRRSREQIVEIPPVLSSVSIEVGDMEPPVLTGDSSRTSSCPFAFPRAASLRAHPAAFTPPIPRPNLRSLRTGPPKENLWNYKSLYVCVCNYISIYNDLVK